MAPFSAFQTCQLKKQKKMPPYAQNGNGFMLEESEIKTTLKLHYSQTRAAIYPRMERIKTTLKLHYSQTLRGISWASA